MFVVDARVDYDCDNACRNDQIKTGWNISSRCHWQLIIKFLSALYEFVMLWVLYKYGNLEDHWKAIFIHYQNRAIVFFKLSKPANMLFLHQQLNFFKKRKKLRQKNALKTGFLFVIHKMFLILFCFAHFNQIDKQSYFQHDFWPTPGKLENKQQISESLLYKFENNIFLINNSNKITIHRKFWFVINAN